MLASMAAVNRASCGRICTLGLDVLVVLEHAGQQQQQQQGQAQQHSKQPCNALHFCEQLLGACCAVRTCG
jgi:hypothetical protein